MAVKEAIVVLRQEVDWRGDPVGEPVSIPFERCDIWPRMSGEAGDLNSVPIAGLNVFIRKPFADVRAKDQVLARGDKWDIDGVPGDFGRKGTLIVLKRAGRTVPSGS